MLFLVEWTVPIGERVDVWNKLGSMTSDDHRVTEGNMNLLARYHNLSGSVLENIPPLHLFEQAYTTNCHYDSIISLKGNVYSFTSTVGAISPQSEYLGFLKCNYCCPVNVANKLYM